MKTDKKIEEQIKEVLYTFTEFGGEEAPNYNRITYMRGLIDGLEELFNTEVQKAVEEAETVWLEQLREALTTHTGLDSLRFSIDQRLQTLKEQREHE